MTAILIDLGKKLKITEGITHGQQNECNRYWNWLITKRLHKDLAKSIQKRLLILSALLNLSEIWQSLSVWYSLCCYANAELVQCSIVIQWIEYNFTFILVGSILVDFQLLPIREGDANSDSVSAISTLIAAVSSQESISISDNVYFIDENSFQLVVISTSTDDVITRTSESVTEKQSSVTDASIEGQWTQMTWYLEWMWHNKS